MLQTWSRGALRADLDILLRTLYVASNRNQTEKEKSSYFVIIKQDREKLESLFFFG